jgi:hypothetical protein
MTRHLSTVSVLHYVYGALIIFGALILGIISFTVGGVMRSDLVQQANDAPPEFVGGIIQGFGGSIATVLLLVGVLVCVSGSWIAKRRNRTGSLIIAGLCCLNFPLGTALGVFTLVTLLNDEVRQAYDAALTA